MAETKVHSCNLDAQMVQGMLYGLKIGPDPAAPTTRLRIYSGSTAGADDGSRLIRVGTNLTLNSAGSGANGLDTGALVNATWYYIYLILKPATETVASLLSASATAPTLPAGYTIKRRVGAVYYLTASGLRKFYQRNCRVTYSDAALIFSGVPDSGWSSVNLVSGKYFPSTGRSAAFQIRGPHTGCQLYLSPDGEGQHFVGASGGNSSDRQDGDGSVDLILPTGVVHIYRAGGNSENTTRIYLSSYEDDLV
ncbi:MAG: hypothetical protein ABFE07_29540 [Armatimonadia bacterium]